MSDGPTRRAVAVGLLATGGLAWAGYPRWKPKNPRAVAQVFPAQNTTDGAGVSLRRALGSRALRMLDPFLLLDEFRSDSPDDYLAGFPDHPHRGFETVTIMLEGAMDHRDSVGNHGKLRAGSIQWMTAGRGIVHSEMPQQEHGLMWGYQLWVNLPAKLKMQAPRYQDIVPSDVPLIDVGEARVRLLAGRIGREEGPVAGVAVDPMVFDATVAEGATFYQELPGAHTAMAYVIDGALEFGEAKTKVERGNLAVFEPGESLLAKGEGRFLLMAGAPIGEPVSRRGPFVMNTDAEIEQAYADYRSGRLGT